MAAKRSWRQLQDRMLLKLPSWLGRARQDRDIVVGVDSPYPEELKRFKKLVSDEKLDDLFARYLLCESQVFNKIAEGLECRSRSDYQKRLLVLARTDKDLASKLKQRIGALSSKLERMEK